MQQTAAQQALRERSAAERAAKAAVSLEEHVRAAVTRAAADAAAEALEPGEVARLSRAAGEAARAAWNARVAGGGGDASAVAEALAAEANAQDAAAEEESFGEVSTWSDYHLQPGIGGLRHPDVIQQTSALSSVKLPPVWYRHCLPRELVECGWISAPQLETLTYACQSHETLLPNGRVRQGLLLGDGAGVGKGRQLAALIVENFLRGRKKAVWVSVSNDLALDAARDLYDLGLLEQVHRRPRADAPAPTPPRRRPRADAPAPTPPRRPPAPFAVPDRHLPLQFVLPPAPPRPRPPQADPHLRAQAPDLRPA
jgi:hypothetical protein